MYWGAYDDGGDPNQVGWGYAYSSDTAWNVFDASDLIGNIPNSGSQFADLNIFAYKTTAVTTAVPKPFTIVGTLIGGTAALRMKKKLAQHNKA